MNPLYMIIGGWEWIIVLVVIAILLFAGGDKIPDLARGLGRAKGELKKGKKEVEKEMEEEEAEKTSSAEDIGDVKSAAESLGIDTEGKSEEELKEEISQALEES